MSARSEPGLAVAVSPHLDDAVFSVGGTLAALVTAGWTVRVVTCFTASVPDPSPFALACQLDKGFPADVDYMALRRAEDDTACALLGVEPVHLPLPEAPHRGYPDPAALFAGVRADDRAAAALAPALRPQLADADVVLAPQALGDHVDHRIVTETVAGLAPDSLFWRDVPYVDRQPAASPWHRVPAGVEAGVDISDQLAAKVAAAGSYHSQLDFQFGRTGVAPLLRNLAVVEAARLGLPGVVEALHGRLDRLRSIGAMPPVPDVAAGHRPDS
ncbi:PIG-L deacetylase family protein [Micromonospora endolithica]|uniref:PIG-L family deacetylase n=1 Tax=Micromonospora endolithica TaxID=230091 RepID=A0A3A9ZK04_9ACTN|nr:PIG-L family deacetylase [Micromonospora endolithica]RKN47646.1 PIG-L family deacetylase [Micromonospora endolithica]TWJ21313.1 LmbE family N-acetylglucosaminyl deacetylase [Micromonospora endolithica]